MGIGSAPIDPLLGQLSSLEDGACFHLIRLLSYLAKRIGDLDKLAFGPKHIAAAKHRLGLLEGILRDQRRKCLQGDSSLG